MQEIYKDQTLGAVVALTTVIAYLNTSVGKTQLRSLHCVILFPFSSLRVSFGARLIIRNGR